MLKLRSRKEDKMICSECGKEITGYPCPFCGAESTAPGDNGKTGRYVEASLTGRYIINEDKHTESAAEAPAAPDEAAAGDSAAAVESRPVEESYGEANLMGCVPADESGHAKGGGRRKKKRRTGLVIGLSVGGAVLVAAAVGYFFFFDILSRFFLGDANYAKLIHKNALSGIVNEITPDDPSLLSRAAGAVSNSFVAGVRTTIQANGNTESGGTGLDVPLPDISGTMLSALVNIPDGKKVSVSSSVDVKVGGAGKMLSWFTDIINGMTVDIAAARNGSTGMASLGISSKGDSIGAAEIYTDGSSAVMTLPGISDTVLKFPGGGEEGSAGRTYDPAEFKRLARDIGWTYISCFDKAKITYTDKLENSAEGDGIVVATEGKSVTIEIDSETLDTTLAAIFDKLANDSYLADFVSEAVGISTDKYKSMFPRTVKTGCSLTFTHLYDKRNNALSTLIRLCGSDGTVLLEISAFGNEDGFSAGVGTKAFGSDIGARIVSKAATKTSGAAYAEVHFGTAQFGFHADYEDVQQITWLGRPNIIGKYTVRPADTELFGKSIAELFRISSDDEDGSQLLKGLKALEITVGTSLEGDSLVHSTAVSLGDAGAFGIKSVVTASDAPSSMPVPTAEFDAESLKALSEDAQEWLKGLVKRISWETVIDSAIDSIANKISGWLDGDDSDESGEYSEETTDFSDEQNELIGTWNVTAVGSKLVSASGYAMQVEVKHDTVTITMRSSNDEYFGSSYPASFGALGNGKFGVYFYQDEAERDAGNYIGYIYTDQSVFAIMYDRGIGQRSYMMRDGIGMNVTVDKTGLKKDLTIDDITGIWEGTDFDGNPYIIAITPDMLVADILTPSAFMKLDGRDGCFAVCRYETGGKAGAELGTLYYSETEDSLLISRGADGAEAILVRIDNSCPDYPYLGEWKLIETNGVPIEQLAEENGLPLDEVAANLEISPFFMITESKAGHDAYPIVGGEMDRFTIEVSTMTGICTYNDTDETFAIVLSYVGSDDTYTMRYKRGRYYFGKR